MQVYTTRVGGGVVDHCVRHGGTDYNSACELHRVHHRSPLRRRRGEQRRPDRRHRRRCRCGCRRGCAPHPPRVLRTPAPAARASATDRRHRWSVLRSPSPPCSQAPTHAIFAPVLQNARPGHMTSPRPQPFALRSWRTNPRSHRPRRPRLRLRMHLPAHTHRQSSLPNGARHARRRSPSRRC